MNAALLSSKRLDWQTPWDVIRGIERFYGRGFDLDVCARDVSAANAPRFYSPDDDGLAQPWDGWCYCNPPYSREWPHWIARALEQSRRAECDGVVCLIPARTDTRPFHAIIAPHAEVVFLAGRIRFLTESGAAEAAPFPSMLATFSRYRRPGMWAGKLNVTETRIARPEGVARTQVAGCD